MSREMYNEKKKFVGGPLLRCLSFAHPELSDLIYQLGDDLEETVIIRFLDGYIRRVCVSGDSLHAIITDVNRALE